MTEQNKAFTGRTIKAAELRAARKAGISGLKKDCRKAKRSLIQGTFGTFGVHIDAAGKAYVVLPYMAVTIARDKATGKVTSATHELEYSHPLDVTNEAPAISAPAK